MLLCALRFDVFFLFLSSVEEGGGKAGERAAGERRAPPPGRNDNVFALFHRGVQASATLDFDRYEALRITLTPGARFGIIGREPRRWRRAFERITVDVGNDSILLVLPAWRGPRRRGRHAGRGPLCRDEAVDW